MKTWPNSNCLIIWTPKKNHNPLNKGPIYDLNNDEIMSSVQLWLQEILIIQDLLVNLIVLKSIEE